MKRLLTLAVMFLCCMATVFAQFSGFGAKSKRVLGGFRFLFTLLLSMCFTIIYAEPVTEQQAFQKAQKFFKDKRLQTKNLRRASRAGQQQSAVQEDFYIFNVEDNGGFVIVSGDDRTEEILGYSDEGRIDIDNMPDNVREWFEGYSKQIRALENMHGVQRVHRIAKSAVAPLIKTKWNQREPYNLLCPEKNGNICPTGCTATAMAQVMYYYKWPQAETAELKEDWDWWAKEEETPAMPATTFDWEKMKLEYSNINGAPNYTNEEAEAVAKLMRYCGQAVYMDYNVNSSAGSVCAEYLTYKFGYSMNATDISRGEYSTTEWEEIIYNEVSSGRPVLYSGYNTGGHAFICDGYDGNGLFHINWGWGGHSDGYFLMDILDPNNEGEEAGYSTDGYSRDQTAIIGIEPNYDEDFKKLIYFTGYRLSSAGRTSIEQDFWFSIDKLEANYAYNNSVFNGEYGLAVYKEDVLQEILLPGAYHGDNPNVKENSSFYFGANWTDNRTLNLYYRIDETDEWKDAHLLSYDYTPEDKSSNFKINNSACIGFWGRSYNTKEIDFKINSVTFDGPIISGEKNYATINLTNTGESYEQPMFFIDETESCKIIASCSAWLSPQETGEVRISLTPKSPGIREIKITSIPTTFYHEDGTQEDRTRTYYSDVITILDGASVKHLNSVKEGLNNAQTYINELKIEIETDKVYEKKSGSDLNTVFNEIISLGNEVSLMEEKVNQGSPLSSDEIQRLEKIKKYASELESYITNNESSVTITCNEGGTVVLGESVMRNVTSKKLYWLSPKAFTNFEYLADKWYNNANYGGIGGDMQFLPDEGYKVECIIHNGNNVDKVDNAFGNVVVTFIKGTAQLTYYVDGEVYKTISYEYGATITPETAPTKEGYTFNGWSDIPSTMPAHDVTVTGSFTVNKYKLIYVVDGEEYKSFEIEYGASITPEDEPTKDGYTFSGWSDIPTTMPAHDVTVTGIFTQVEFNIDGVTYEITGNGEVTIIGGDEKGEVTIESTVKINGQTYQVTGIADNAFKNNQDITSVTIPEGLTSIGDNAFNGCTGLIVINIGKDVHTIGNKAFAYIGTAAGARTRSEANTIIVNCYAESVPQTASNAFENTPIETGMLFVEDNLKNAFKSTSPWSRFGNIIGFEEAAGINSITTGTEDAWIFDMQGNRLDNTRKGVNIIRTKDGKTKKILLK